MTSNPTIFQKAIAETELYDEDIRRARRRRARTPLAIFEGLAVADVQRAADVFRPVFDETRRRRRLRLDRGGAAAGERHARARSARRAASGRRADGRTSWSRSRGRPPGVPAIRQCLAEGININITLLFSVPRYREVMEAYLSAIEERVAAGKPGREPALGRELLRQPRGHQRRQEARRESRRTTRPRRGRSWRASSAGKARRSPTRASPTRPSRRSSDRRASRRSKTKGARLQRPLWASTSTKDPAYPDLYYVEALVAPDTVDTMPPETFEAYRDHGDPKVRIHDDLDGRPRRLPRPGASSASTRTRSSASSRRRG